jgi:hypothetical protein
VNFQPDDIVIRLADCPPEQPRERSGMRQYASYRVTAVRGDMLRLVGVGGWWSAKCFDVVPEDPCA